MTQNAMQAKKSRSFTVGVSFRLSSYYSLMHTGKLKDHLNPRINTKRWIYVLVPLSITDLCQCTYLDYIF